MNICSFVKSIFNNFGFLLDILNRIANNMLVKRLVLCRHSVGSTGIRIPIFNSG